MFKYLLVSALGISAVNAHGWLTKPAATFDNAAGDKSQFIATIEASSSGFKGTFNTAPADNVASFTKAFSASKYKSLKEFIDDKAKITVTGATLTCGNAEPDAAAQPLPATLEWSHSDSEGFTASHEGPCEAWCEDTRVFNDENCAANFKTAPAEMPYEKSKCSGAKMLTFYWMAMHGPTWQVYVNCAPLSGGGATTQDAGSTSTTTTDSSSASTPTADTPTVTSSTQTSSSGNSSPSATTAPSTTESSSDSASTPSTPSAETPTVTTAPSTGGSPSTETTPSTSTTTDESDCGSYDVAGSESDCDEYDVAGGSEDEGQDTGAQKQQGSTNTGTQQQTSTDTQSQTNTGTQQQTNTGTQQQQTNAGGNNNYWQGGWGNTNTGAGNTGGNNNYWQGGWGNTNTGTGTQTNTYQGTGSQTSFDFNSVKGKTDAGTVSPQKM